MEKKKLKKMVPILFCVAVLVLTIVAVVLYKGRVEGKLTEIVTKQSRNAGYQNISVDFDGRTAYLKGYAKSKSDVKEIEQFVDDIRGVKFVNSKLKVKKLKVKKLKVEEKTRVKPIAQVVQPKPQVFVPPAPVIDKTVVVEEVQKIEAPVVVTEVDRDPEVVVAEVVEQRVLDNSQVIDLLESKRIYFQTNSHYLSDTSKSHLETVAKFTTKYPDFNLEVIGSADVRGIAEKNAGLGLARANAVRSYLVELGVPSQVMVTRSIGESVSDDRTPDNLWKYRSVQFKLNNAISH